MRVSGSLQHEDGSGFLQRETDLIPYNKSGWLAWFFTTYGEIFQRFWFHTIWECEAFSTTGFADK